MTGSLAYALGHPRRVLVLAALLALACLPGLARLESDNTPHVFFRSGSAEADEYARFHARFGADEALRLVLRGPVLSTPAGLAFLGDLERRAARLAGVQSVVGLASAETVWPPAEPGVRAALDDPLWRNLGVLAEDGRLVSVLLVLAPQTAREQAALLASTERLLASPPAGVRAEVVGMAALNRALDASSLDVLRKYFPLLVVLAILLLVAILRGVAAVVLPLVFVLLCELALFGPMGCAGVRLNMVLAVLAPLVLVIAIATAMYVQVRFNDARREGLAPTEAVEVAYAAKRRPLIWTSVTTVVGFGALMLSHLGPVRALGFWSVISTLEMVVFVFAVYPALLVCWPDRFEPASFEIGAARCPEIALQELGSRAAAWGIRHRRAVIAGAGLLAVAGLAGFARLRVEGNALTYLPRDHPVRAAIERLEASGVGSASVELVLEPALEREAASAPSLASGEGLSRLSFLAERLREIPGAVGVVGAGDLVDAALRRAPEEALRAAGFGGGDALRAAALARLRAEPRTARLIGRFLTADGAGARVTIFTHTVGLDALQPLLSQATALAAEEFAGARVVATGEFPLLLDMQRGLLETLGASLGLTLVAVAAVFFHLLRSARYTPLALVTSLLPVVVVIGGMGWFGVPLDIATVMIASIVLGLAGDDTIHTVDRFRVLAPSHGPSEAVIAALSQNAPAYLVTALVRLAGFGVCALSGFVPIHRFGALSALAIGLATLTDLVVVAALLGGKGRAP